MAQGIELNILLAVQNILQRDTQLLTYLNPKNVLLGIRDNIKDNQYPVIILEPMDTKEVIRVQPKAQELQFQIGIACKNKHYNYDEGVIGGNAVVGIMNFVADTKNAIEKYIQLNWDSTGPRCDRYEFQTTKWLFENYPFRSGEIYMNAYKLLPNSTSR